MNQDSLKTLLLCLLSLVGMTTFAYDCEVDGIYYNLNENDHTASVTYKEQYKSNYSGDIDIPETFNYSNETYTVTSIGEWAFYYCDLTSVQIPNTVTSIGRNAFYSCRNLKELTIPVSVTNIGFTAFGNCTAIETITVAEGNTVYDSRDNCNAIIKTADNELVVGCKSTHIPNSVTSIGYSAFYGCTGLTSLEIPDGVTSIGMNAFSDCSGLTAVTIPSSVVSIGDEAFSGCSSLETIVVDKDNKYYDSRDNCNAIISKSNNGLIVGCKNSHIPDDVTSIHNYAFRFCDFPSLVIPNSVTSIGYYAFSDCRSLRELTIGSGVTSIGYYAFSNCTDLTSIVSLIEEPFAISDNVFTKGSENATLYVPKNTKSKYVETDGWKNFSKIIEDIEEEKAEADEAYKKAQELYEQYIYYYSGEGMEYYQQIAKTQEDNTEKPLNFLATLRLSRRRLWAQSYQTTRRNLT